MNFLAGVVTGPGRVRLDGAEIECPALDGLSQGAAVTICIRPEDVAVRLSGGGMSNVVQARIDGLEFLGSFWRATLAPNGGAGRSEEHTSELPSLTRISYAVFCLKKKKYYLQLPLY